MRPSGANASVLMKGDASSSARTTVATPSRAIFTSDESPVGCSTIAYRASPPGVQFTPFTAPSSRTIVGTPGPVNVTFVPAGVKYARREPSGDQRGSAAGGIESCDKRPPFSAYQPGLLPTMPTRASAPAA